MKRTLDTYFSSPSGKKNKSAENGAERYKVIPDSNVADVKELDSIKPKSTIGRSTHDVFLSTTLENYPHALPDCPVALSIDLPLPGEAVKHMTEPYPNLDIIVYHPMIPRPIAQDLFKWLRGNLFWYRVSYLNKRFGKEINTPRFTTVFGLDDTLHFDENYSTRNKLGIKQDHPIPPRPIPDCLRDLLALVTALTEKEYNVILLNYYADGADSISFHSDDESFLYPNPAIASLSLGGTRTFKLKHKVNNDAKLSFVMNSGDMILTQGETQKKWLHAIPKCAHAEGRINITFRRARNKAGTDNYYQYNVGEGPVFKWNGKKMVDIGRPPTLEDKK